MTNKLSNLSRQEETALILKELANNGSFAEYCIAIDRGYQLEWFHEEVARKLEQGYKRLLAGEDVRIMFFMPPRHGKSDMTTQKFTSWVLGKTADIPIMVSSYSDELATDFGQRTRDIMQSPEYQVMFNTRLRPDAKAKGKWLTQNGGSYTAVGVGGALTGRGFKIGIIDDPFKNREEADSQVIRDSRHKWYQSTFSTREEGNSMIIFILCMTGDTPVMMANGTERLLKDIRKGDEVATYKNGKLSTSIVKNWKSNGIDSVFAIKTTSGKIVRANKRHPFLIYDKGELKWIRTKDLHPGQDILRVNGENGKTKLARGKDAISQSSVEGIAHPITTKNDGKMELGHHLFSMNGLSVLQNLKTVMGLLWKITNRFFPSKMASVQYANNPPVITSGLIGEETFVSTIVTTQEKSGRFYVMTATLLSAMRKLMRPLWLWRNTCDFTLDKIVEITPSGTEEVFDIQVEDTENFIANGLVSHNTRWHEDDLAGRVLKEAADARKNGEPADDWDIIQYKAIATEDEPQRKEGEALWPSKFPLDKLQAKKAVMGSYEFSALYQQNPVDEENRKFKTDWFKTRPYSEVAKLQTLNFMTIDPRGKDDIKQGKDYIGVTVNFVDREGNWNILSYRMKLSATQLIDLMFTFWGKYNLTKIGIEDNQFTQGLMVSINEQMRSRGTFFALELLKHGGTQKELRIESLVPRYEKGGIYHLTIDGQNQCTDLEEELLLFPKATNDDASDSLAFQGQIVQIPFDDDDSYTSGDVTTMFTRRTW